MIGQLSLLFITTISRIDCWSSGRPRFMMLFQKFANSWIGLWFSSGRCIILEFHMPIRCWTFNSQFCHFILSLYVFLFLNFVCCCYANFVTNNFFFTIHFVNSAQIKTSFHRDLLFFFPFNALVRYLTFVITMAFSLHKNFIDVLSTVLTFHSFNSNSIFRIDITPINCFSIYLLNIEIVCKISNSLKLPPTRSISKCFFFRSLLLKFFFHTFAFEVPWKLQSFTYLIRKLLNLFHIQMKMLSLLWLFLLSIHFHSINFAESNSFFHLHNTQISM